MDLFEVKIYKGIECVYFMKQEKKQICFECSKYINPKEHIVCLSTYNRFLGKEKLEDDHTWFHFQCFVDNFNKNVQRKSRQQVQFLQSKALEVFSNPEIRHLLSRIKGTENLFSMLNTDLTEKVVPKEKVLQKLKKNGRKTKSRKTKM